MEKSKRNTRKKHGGRKNNNYGSRYLTQTAGFKNVLGYNSILGSKYTGGTVAPAAARTYNDSSIRTTLENFGNSMINLQYVISNDPAIDAAQAALDAQDISAQNFKEAITRLYDSFRGTLNTAGQRRGGLFQAIYGETAVFTPSPA
jgi:hypothetical protein